LSLNNTRIIYYMWSPDAKNMVKKDLLWESCDRRLRRHSWKKKKHLQLPQEKVTYLETKEDAIAFPLSHQQLLSKRELP